MKNVLFALILVLGTANAFAASSVYECLINRSYSVQLMLNHDDNSVTVNSKLWNAEAEEVFTSENSHIVNHGKVLVAVVDAGRSGYALFRLEPAEIYIPETNFRIQGNVDINFFSPAAKGINTNGMKNVACRSIITQ
jgi:hypothetical protein